MYYELRIIRLIARIFDSLGRPITNEIIVNNKGICADPVVSVTNETIIIAWEQLDLKNNNARWDIHIKKYDLNKINTEKEKNTEAIKNINLKINELVKIINNETLLQENQKTILNDLEKKKIKTLAI